MCSSNNGKWILLRQHVEAAAAPAAKLVSTWRRVKSIEEIFHTLQTTSLPIELSVQPLHETLEDHVINVANIRGFPFDFDTYAF